MRRPEQSHRRAVTGRQAVLNNAADVFKWCETNMVLDAPGSKRHFHFVPAGTIQRNRPETDVQPLKGIRMLHQIRNVSGVAYTLAVNRHTCYCERCIKGSSEPCFNCDYVSGQQLHVLKPNNNTWAMSVAATIDTVSDSEGK